MVSHETHLQEPESEFESLDVPPHRQAPDGNGGAVAAPLAKPVRHWFSDGIRYLYLMRFSLILWLSMLLLAWADAYTGAASMTRGILTPFSPPQWFFTGLAVVLPGWFALLAARIVCAYGETRFLIHPPSWFLIRDRMEWFAFWGAQIPGVLLLARIAYNVRHERESRYYLPVVACLLLGAFVALLFWYIISILYYWIWDPEATIPVRAFLVPHWNAIPLDEIQDMPCGSSLRLLSRATNILGRFGPGYCVRRDDQRGLFRTAPGHVVATIALVCALILYLLLMPITAPIPMPGLAWAGKILSVLLGIYLLIEFILPASRALRQHAHIRVDGRKPSTPRARVLPLLASLFMLAPVALGIVSPWAPRAVPVIAYVSVLLVVVFWTMAGIAFFADHYRVPVLTLATAIILGLNHWPAEHVFPARPIDHAQVAEDVATPPEFTRRIAFHNNQQDDDPVVIITATGGGIHAAAWTATALRALDDGFRSGGIPLNSHILLMSSVSGGSVATAGFLREYFTPDAFSAHSFDRVEGTASCSSLQAVAWGLTYPDTLRLVFPFVFNLFPSLDRFDRGWALQRAIDRNLHDPNCIQDSATRETAGPSLANLSLNSLSRLDPASRLCSQHRDACLHFPAFTLNSTVVETGDRFLLSNYSVFADEAGTDEVLPAASFLGVYGRDPILPLPPASLPENTHPAAITNRGYADISILTAARLSASFTYVSPATRIPFEQADAPLRNAYHFVDGGYFDNDGTNSAIEFLKAASSAFSPQRPLRVLLVEIRNADDLNINDSPDSFSNQSGLKWNYATRTWSPDPNISRQRMGPIGELMAPLKAAKEAGLDSTTARNRRELDTLERAYCGSLELKHVVLDYQRELRRAPNGETLVPGESELDQPLSWHLTRRQREWIDGPNSLNGRPDYALDRKQPVSDRQAIAQAVGWFQSAQSRAHAAINPAVTCRRSNLGR